MWDPSELERNVQLSEYSSEAALVIGEVPSEAKTTCTVTVELRHAARGIHGHTLYWCSLFASFTDRLHLRAGKQRKVKVFCQSSSEIYFY